MTSNSIKVEKTFFTNMLNDEPQLVNVPGEHQGWAFVMLERGMTTAKCIDKEITCDTFDMFFHHIPGLFLIARWGSGQE